MLAFKGCPNAINCLRWNSCYHCLLLVHVAVVVVRSHPDLDSFFKQLHLRVCVRVCHCMYVCVLLPVISSENSVSIDGKFECNFEPSSLLLLFSLFLAGCFWVRKECRARWKAACAQTERTVYTEKSEATARQRTTTTRDCQLLQARQTDRQDCVPFFLWFFLLLLFPPRKALAICLCTRNVFE